ncbi:DNA-binding protein [Glaciihabitans arcticus]|uniref:DNA-binding protein n=1 Tax=Glaciihabitans arcticus TaxID=2668039 RepID=A0A4Q9GSU4_9MICO|nr:DNA-binding protein [Glaciihabitans arcticus]TBN56157.1 DNA-binding protein [Glaciihabitans arcticus]
MFVLTIDQVDSRRTADAVTTVIAELRAALGGALVLPPERTAGDEFQLLIREPAATLDTILRLTRAERWSVGCGVGSVREPLPRDIREATGEAFLAARTAVERAKKRQSRFALEAAGARDAATHLEALIDLLLATRSRRSLEGWQLHDLLVAGSTQAAAASELGITPQAASLRARAADLKTEAAVTGALVTLLAELDGRAE